MADGVPITPGSGAVVATDDAGAAGQVQIVKLAVSADGSATAIPATSDGLKVDLGADNDVTVTGTVTVDGSGVTQPVSAASLPLPSGAATAAKQPALGVAGTPSADVLTVQGAASMTAVKVDGSAVTQPVSGTVTASGPVTDAELRATAVPVSLATVPSHAVTGPLTDAELRAAAVPVSAASLPLPSGAATETTLGTRLSESDFDSKVGALTETAPLTDTASSGLNGRLQRIAQRLTTLLAQLVTGGGTEATALRVTVASDSTGVVSVDDNGASLTVDGPLTDTELRATAVPVSLASVPSHAVTNAGTFAVQADTELTTGDLDTGAGTDTRAVVGLVGSKSGGGEIIPGSATDGLLVNLGANNDVAVSGTVTADLGATDNAVLDDIAAKLATIDADTSTLAAAVSTEVQVDVVGALPAGTNAIGKLAANSGVDIGDVDVTSISAGANLIGDVGIKPRTSGGLTTFMASGSDGSSILVATAQAVKASAGQLFGYYLYNPESAVTFVHFYNTAAASVTVGTTNPMFTLAIPPASAANLMSEIGIAFSNAGWSVAATTTAGGNTAPATGVSAVLWYA